MTDYPGTDWKDKQLFTAGWRANYLSAVELGVMFPQELETDLLYDPTTALLGTHLKDTAFSRVICPSLAAGLT